MHIEDAKEMLEANGLDVYHGSEPESYRVKLGDNSMIKSIKVRSVDLPTLARIIDKVADNEIRK